MSRLCTARRSPPTIRARRRRHATRHRRPPPSSLCPEADAASSTPRPSSDPPPTKPASHPPPPSVLRPQPPPLPRGPPRPCLCPPRPLARRRRRSPAAIRGRRQSPPGPRFDVTVVNLKEARDFSNSKGFIYVFKKLEWQSLSVDLLPHPDMFADAQFNSSNSQDNKRDDDGAKRMFFGGERFLEGISGEANITPQ